MGQGMVYKKTLNALGDTLQDLTLVLKESKSRVYMTYRGKQKCLQSIFKEEKQRDSQGCGMEKNCIMRRKDREVLMQMEKQSQMTGWR